MIKVGMQVMVRDNWITKDYHVPPAKVVQIKECPVLMRKSYLLEFENGAKEWFETGTVKTE